MPFTAAMKKPLELSLLDEVMSSPLLTDREKSIYKVIHDSGPISAENIQITLNIINAWSALSPLRARGMIKEANDSQYTSHGRKAKTWVVTDKKPIKDPLLTKRKAFETTTSPVRPTDHELKMFSTELAVLYAVSHSKGARISKEARRVQRWIASGAKCKCTSSSKSAIRKNTK